MIKLPRWVATLALMAFPMYVVGQGAQPANPAAPAEPPNGLSSTLLGTKPVVMTNCPIRPLYDVKIPVRVAGVLAEVNVKETSEIKKGQVIARIDDRLALIEARAKKAKADNEAGWLEAQAREKEAGIQVETYKKLREKRSTSEEEYRLREVQLEIAARKVDDAKNQMDLERIGYEAAQEQVKLHEVVSPIDGVVVQQVRQEGEAVQALDPIVRAIRTDIVRVEGNLSTRELDRIQKGMSIDVYPSRSVSEVLLFRGHTGSVHDVKVLSDGRRCASAGGEGSIFIWNIATGQRESILPAAETAVLCLGVGKGDPNRLVSGGIDQKLRVWDISAGSEVKSISTGSVVLSLAMHPLDDDLCFTGHEDRQIRLWNLRTGERVTMFSGHTNFVNSLAVTSDGRLLVSASTDLTVRVWDIEQRKELRRFGGRSPDVRQVGISPDNQTFLFNNYSFLQARTLLTDQPIGSIENRTGSFTDVAVFTPVTGMVLVSGGNYQLQLWQLGDASQYPRQVRSYEGHVDQVNAVDFAGDGTFFVSGSADRSVRVWEIPSPRQVARERKRGVIAGINRQVEAGSETLAVYAEIENKDGALVPGTFATMVVYPGRQSEQAAR